MENILSPVDAISRWAQYQPDKVAITGSGHSWTYREFHQRIHETALDLQENLGLRRGDRVAILAENHPFFFELAYAALRTGIILVPLNFRLSASELTGVLCVCRPRLLIASATYRLVAESLEWEPDPGDPAPIRRDMESFLEPRDSSGKPPTHPFVGTDMEETAFLLFTSGTTGRPKAAQLAARQVFWNAVNTILAFQLTAADSTILYTPLFHTGAINVLATPLFQAGGTVHVLEGFDPTSVVSILVERKVTTLFGVPITFQMLADGPGFLDEARRHLRLCLCGGAPLPISLIQRYQEAGVVLTQGFGMTEVGPNCFYLPAQEALTRAGSVGKPIHYVSARIRVEGREALPGEVGELELAGPLVTPGYFRNEAETAKALVDGWFHTGDLAQTDEEGFYRIAGRGKDMFISGGENVYPAEVEVAMMGHPSVQECCVVPVPDEKWGEVGLAYVVSRDSSLNAEVLRPWLRARLAGYKVPRTFVFRSDILPRNPSGKVVKADLVKEALNHVEK